MFAAVRTSILLLSPKQRFAYLVLVSMRVVTNLLDVAGVAAIGVLAAVGAGGFLGQSEVTFLGFTVELGSPSTLLSIMTIVGALFVSKAVLSILMLGALVRFLARIEVAAATRIATYLFSSGLGRMRRYSKSEVQFAVTSSTDNTFSGILGSLGVFLTESGLLLMMVIFFLLVDPAAAIGITGYFLAVTLIFQFAINGSLRRAGIRSAEGHVGVTQAALDLFDGFREISILQKQDYYLTRFERSRWTKAIGEATIRFLGAIPRFFVETALVLGALGFTAWQLFRGELADGLVAVGVFLTGGVRIMAALLPLQNAFAALKTQAPQAQLSQEILFEIKSSEGREVAESHEIGLDVSPSIEGDLGLSIDFRGVTFAHQGNQEATIHDLTLSIPSGGYVALVGPSGAGKTTLADLVLGLHKPNSGHVSLGGIPAHYLRERLPGLMSYVPQKPGLVSGSLSENVALGVAPTEIDRDRVHSVLQKVQLDEFIMSLPAGIDTLLGKHADSLSGGQIQRLGMARALYTQPRLIVLDEATSALDAEAEASISSTILALGRTTTVVVIAHRLSTVQHADSVHVIDGGMLVASGTFSHLRKTVPMIQEYVRLMSFEED